MKRFIFLTLLLFSCCQEPTIKENSGNVEQSQVQYDISLDKSKALNERLGAINKSIQLSKKSDSFLAAKWYQKQFLHFSLRQYDSVLACSNKIAKNTKSHKYNLYMGRQHHLIGYFYDEVLTNLDSAFYHYNLSKSYFLRFNDSTSVGRRLISMGLIQKNQNDFFGSKETLTEALQYLTVQNDSNRIASCYNAIATNHRKLLNQNDAIDYYSRAIEASGSQTDRCIYQNNLATTFIDMMRYDEAIQILQRLVNNPIVIENVKEYARVTDNLAYAQWLYGGGVSEEVFLDALKIRKKNKDRRGQIASYTHLGEFHRKTKPQIAESYFDSVIHLSRSLKIPRAEKDVLKLLMKLRPNDLKLRDRYIFLQDSLYAEELKVKTQFAKYKYDDRLKQESILRLEKENAEKELAVAQERNQKLLSNSAGGVLLLLSLFLSYFFVQRMGRLKQQNKTAKLEATFETESQLSRRLHDDFGGKLNHAMLLLQNGADNIEVLNVVDGLYNQSRAFSREINDVDTGSNFKDFLFGMMGNYCKTTKLIVTGSTDIDWVKISALSKKTLYKVLQELMINMQRHSGASLVSVTFEQSKKKLKVHYADNGIGASKEALNTKNGLWNTEKRIHAIGGTIIFDSEKANGFEAQIEVPN